MSRADANSSFENELLVDYINKIIRTSVDYGGDGGGGYCSDEEIKKELLTYLERFRKWYGLDDYAIIEVFDGHYYRLGKVIKVEETKGE